MCQIKIGRKEYEVKEGDYITFNGNVHQFHSGDNRALLYEKHGKVTSVTLPAKALKEIDLQSLKNSKYSTHGIEIERWTF